MDRQSVYRRRLLRANGAPVRLRPRAFRDGPAITGRWTVTSGGRYFVRPDAAALPALLAFAAGPWGGCADVELELPAGTHAFFAMVRQAPGVGLWEIVLHPRSEVRVAGPIALLPTRRDGTA